MKKRSHLLKYMLLISSVLIGLIGAFIKYEVLEPLSIHREESIMALPFVLLADESLSYRVSTNLDMLMNPTEPAAATQPTVPAETAFLTKTTEPSTQPPTEAPTEAPTEPPTQPSTEPTYAPVTESWFDDVLFIGDSRTVGLREYGRLGEADYFCDTSMSVFTALRWECSDLDFTNKTLEELLEENTYGKVFIHLGLNEMGEDPELILERYQEIIDLVREYQPDAAIIVQAVMSVTRGKASNPTFSLERIQYLNTRLEEKASEQGLYFIDTNAWITDEEGYMLEPMTFDGCHLYGTGYQQWSQWIFETVGWLDIT